MKMNIKKQLYLLLSLIAFLSSCNSDPELYTLTTPSDRMQVKASTDSLVLQKAFQDQEAIKFTWNDATDRGADTQLTYYFRIYMSDVKTNISELVKISDGQRTISYTHRQINDLLASWNITPGDKVNLVGEVIAKVTASKQYMKPETSKTEFKTIGYDPADVMYMMAKTSSGQNLTITMETTNEDGVYHWAGVINSGEFWFSSDKTKGYPAYIKGADDNSLVYSDTGAGSHFTLSDKSMVDVTIDLNKMTITLLQTPIMYMVSSNAGAESATEIPNIDVKNGYYHWSGTLQAGTEIRFASDAVQTWPAYVPDPNDPSKLVVGQSGAAMLKVTQTAKYEVVISLVDKKLICTSIYNLPYNGMWAAGSAVPAGWDNGRNSCAFAQTDIKNHPEIWTLTTAITAGNEFKIITVPGQWNYEIMPIAGGANPINSWVDCGVRGVNVSSDNKFIPQSSGTWTIKMDLHNMKLMMVQE